MRYRKSHLAVDRSVGLHDTASGPKFAIINEMCDHTNPLIIPARNSGPNVVRLEWPDLPMKRAQNRADDQVARHRRFNLQEDGRKEQLTEIRSRYIEISDVGRIGFMKVEVPFRRWRP